MYAWKWPLREKKRVEKSEKNSNPAYSPISSIIHTYIMHISLPSAHSLFIDFGDEWRKYITIILFDRLKSIVVDSTTHIKASVLRSPTSTWSPRIVSPDLVTRYQLRRATSTNKQKLYRFSLSWHLADHLDYTIVFMMIKSRLRALFLNNVEGSTVEKRKNSHQKIEKSTQNRFFNALRNLIFVDFLFQICNHRYSTIVCWLTRLFGGTRRIQLKKIEKIDFEKNAHNHVLFRTANREKLGFEHWERDDYWK